MEVLKGIDLSNPWRVLECYWTDGRHKVFKNYMIDIFGNVKNTNGMIDGIEYTCCGDAVRKLHPGITDKKEMKRLEERYRNRAKFI